VNVDTMDADVDLDLGFSRDVSRRRNDEWLTGYSLQAKDIPKRPMKQITEPAATQQPYPDVPTAPLGTQAFVETTKAPPQVRCFVHRVQVQLDWARFRLFPFLARMSCPWANVLPPYHPF